MGCGAIWRICRALRRHPLVRLSDRIELVVAAVALAIALATVPVAGAIGTQKAMRRAVFGARELGAPPTIARRRDSDTPLPRPT